ncbi:MAG: hypothetical protein IH934_05665 [Nanoarchaeota archaeon]|nr:hypothetical protein [Nanoarchaeota archaeon]
MFKPITKERNKRKIIIYYSIAVIFLAIGFFTNNNQWTIFGIVILGLALFRKYFLMKRLKE